MPSLVMVPPQWSKCKWVWNMSVMSSFEKPCYLLLLRSRASNTVLFSYIIFSIQFWIKSTKISIEKSLTIFSSFVKRFWVRGFQKKVLNPALLNGVKAQVRQLLESEGTVRRFLLQRKMLIPSTLIPSIIALALWRPHIRPRRALFRRRPQPKPRAAF